MIQNLSLAQWHRLAGEGVCPPMRVQVIGISMIPLLRARRDYVTIVPVTEPPQRGDIMLFADPLREKRYVLHRVWQVGEDAVLFWGDNCARPDGWIPLSQVWGKAVLIERGKRRITPDPARGLRMARCWHVVGKGWRFVRKAYHWTRNRIRKVFRRQ